MPVRSARRRAGPWRALRVALAAVATALPGCGRVEAPTSVQVRVSVDPATCGTDDPAVLPLGCAGEVGVWLLDGSDTERSSRCISLALDQSRSLRQLPALLADADVEFADLAPDDEVALEVAAYSPAAGIACPRYEVGGTPAPVYFGRSPTVSLSGDQPVIPLTLYCVSWPAPVAPSCGDEPRDFEITASVTDLETLSPLALARVGQVDVSFGDVRAPAPGIPGILLTLAQLVPDGVGATWRGTLPQPPILSGCPATAVELTNVGVPTLSCQAETSPDGSRIATVGYHLDLENVPALFDFGESFTQGLVLGRVVDGAGAPVGDAYVEVATADASVFYLSEDRTTFFELSTTSSNGYFMVYAVDGQACCHTLIAATLDGTRTGTSLAPVAFVQNALTAVLVRVQ